MSYGGVFFESGWTEQRRNARFYAAYQSEQRDEVVGVLLALFLGSFGAHHFYLRRTGLGILYLVFFWTGIPAMVSFVECFLMPGRVRRYNWEVASYFMATLPAPATPPTGTQPEAGAAATLALPPARCAQCDAAQVSGAYFCQRCGHAY